MFCCCELQLYVCFALYVCTGIVCILMFIKNFNCVLVLVFIFALILFVCLHRSCLYVCTDPVCMFA